MSYSLLVGTGGLGSAPGVLELSPEAGGPYFLLGEQFTLGAPTALTRAIESAAVDGEKISGRRHGNRLVEMLIVVKGATVAERDANVEALLGFVDSQEWTLTWTPDTANPLPMMILCRRSSFTPDYELDLIPAQYLGDGQPATLIHVQAVARPFVYTPTPSSIRSVGGTLVIDHLDSLGRFSGASIQVISHYGTTDTPNVTHNLAVVTSPKVEGTGALQATYSLDNTAQRVRTFLDWSGPGVDLSGYDQLGIYVRADGSFGSFGHYTVQFQAIDGGGHSAYSSGSALADTGNLNASHHVGSFDLLTDVVPDDGIIDLTNIVRIIVRTFQDVTGPAGSATVTVDKLEALETSVTLVSVPNGGTYLAPNVPGTARTPVAVAVTSAGGGATLLEGLVLHKAPPEARADYQPIIPYASAGHALSSRARPVNLGLDYDGTFGVYLAGTIATTATARQLTVIFEQFNASGGLGSVTLVSRPTRGNTPPPPGGISAFDGLLAIDVLDWPALPVPDDATGVYTTVTVLDPGAGATAPQDVLVLDVRGPTVIATSNSQYLWIDLPKNGRDLGDVLTGPDRANAFGQWAYAEVTGGQFSMDPGDNTFFAYATVGGPPSVEIDVYPAWLRARTS